MDEKNTNVDKESKPNSEKNKKENKSLATSFKEFRGEFRKIIWPTRSELIKKTATVIVTSLCFGLIVFAMDTVFSFGYTTFIDLVTRVQ